MPQATTCAATRGHIAMWIATRASPRAEGSLAADSASLSSGLSQGEAARWYGSRRAECRLLAACRLNKILFVRGGIYPDSPFA